MNRFPGVDLDAFLETQFDRYVPADATRTEPITWERTWVSYETPDVDDDGNEIPDAPPILIEYWAYRGIADVALSDSRKDT